MIKQWWMPVLFIVIGILFISSGIISNSPLAIQDYIRKLSLLSIWYVATYMFRFYRIGHINWNKLGEKWKAIYYFVLLIGSAFILGWG
ncbi:MAG: hypothetical protein QXW35_03580 [Candidatus Aenigmatarchaeota archaeon]